MNNNKFTFGMRVVCINKTKRYIGQKGWEPASTSKAIQCSKCPVCGHPTLMHTVKKGENFRDETVGIFGVCISRYKHGEEKCSGKAWIRKPLYLRTPEERPDAVITTEVANE